jgi:uncharacterized cupin superfamily protein
MRGTGIVHWDDCKRRLVEMDDLAAHWTNLGMPAGTVTTGLRRVEIEPGRRSTPVHVHGAEEELVYVLGGSGQSWQDGEGYGLREGDCLAHLPWREAHTLIAGPDGLDVLIFGQRTPVEAAYLPRAGVAWLGATWVEAGQGEQPWAREIAAGELARPEPRSPLGAGQARQPADAARAPHIVNVEDVEAVTGGKGDTLRTRRDLGRAVGSDKTGLQYVEIKPGKLGCPPHCHSSEEEVFVALEGDGVCLLGDEEHAVKPGTVVARPAGTAVAHAFRAGQNGLTYLAYGERRPEDMCYYPRSNKIYFGWAGVIARFEKLDYWDGEDK